MDPSRSPRVLYLIDTGGPGGAETVLASLVESLSGTGWKTRVLIPERGWLYDRLIGAGHELRITPTSGPADIRFLHRIIREVRDFRPDLIHAHLFTSSVYSSLASMLASGPPVVCTFHGTPDVNPSDKLLRIKAAILRRAHAHAVFVAHHLARKLTPLLGLPDGQTHVIHNGRPFRTDSPDPVDLGLPGDAYLIGAVGNVRESKDYPTLLHAAAIVCERMPSVHFVIAGEEGVLGARLRELRSQMNLTDRVHLLGFRDDVPALLETIDLFVSSSASEGLPLATLEATAAGLPAVLTDCGGPREIVRHGETGLLVPPGDPAALAEGILKLLDDPARARRMGRAARTDVRARFGLDQMSHRYEELYEFLIRRPLRNRVAAERPHA